MVQEKTYKAYYHSPIGWLEIITDDESLQALSFNNTKDDKKNPSKPPQIIQDTILQLHEYFEGQRKQFDLKLKPTGTDFQKKVWNKLTEIPFGKTISYLELAKRLGDVKAIRAAGTANGKNKIAVIVPCHRVIGANGELVGYAGELWRKKWLLEHEGKIENGLQTLF
jgi:methylated-DNA-[protein]-cysteine S-methyltransferase